MNNSKGLLLKLGQEMETKIDQIRSYQKQMHDILKEKTQEEYEELEQDPELQELQTKLNQKLDELW